MGNADEIRARIISKEKNAKTWYENAQSEHRNIINSDIEDKKRLSSICVNDMENIAAYMSELREVAYLIMFNGNITVTVFDEATKDAFNEACKTKEGPKPFEYKFLQFFQFGEGLKEAYLYIPPITAICSKKYEKYEPPSGDDGD
jgi:hypothetical protein